MPHIIRSYREDARNFEVGNSGVKYKVYKTGDGFYKVQTYSPEFGNRWGVMEGKWKSEAEAIAAMEKMEREERGDDRNRLHPNGGFDLFKPQTSLLKTPEYWIVKPDGSWVDGGFQSKSEAANSLEKKGQSGLKVVYGYMVNNKFAKEVRGDRQDAFGAGIKNSDKLSLVKSLDLTDKNLVNTTVSIFSVSDGKSFLVIMNGVGGITKESGFKSVKEAETFARSKAKSSRKDSDRTDSGQFGYFVVDTHSNYQVHAGPFPQHSQAEQIRDQKFQSDNVLYGAKDSGGKFVG